MLKNLETEIYKFKIGVTEILRCMLCHIFVSKVRGMASYTGGEAAQTRIKELFEERQRQREEIERRRTVIVAGGADVSAKFEVRDGTGTDDLKLGSGGLVTHSDYKALRLKRQRNEEKPGTKEKEVKVQPRRKAVNRAKLSFADDSEESEDEEEEQVEKRRRVVKNPDADTACLPDRKLEAEKRAAREELEDEWRAEQERIKAEFINVTFSYWNGTGHRRVARVKKGTSIAQFLGLVRAEFKEIKHVATDSLMYVKEDLIIPHHFTFYDFIVSRARGKSGPLFAFDAADDVRLLSDAGRERVDTHAGKVVHRTWFERNRHIFPASRWEVYDPAKNYDKYTIKD